MFDKKLTDKDFIRMVADGLKKHCEKWGYNWIEKLKSEVSIKNFRRLFFNITHLYYIYSEDDCYNVTFDTKKDVAYIKKCGKDFDNRDIDATIDIGEIIKLLVGDSSDETNI